jgi:hypothetical protein
MDTGIVRTLASGLPALGCWLLSAAAMAGGEIAPVRIPAAAIAGTTFVDPADDPRRQQ